LCEHTNSTGLTFYKFLGRAHPFTTMLRKVNITPPIVAAK
jgi:hypothetical protein